MTKTYAKQERRKHIKNVSIEFDTTKPTHRFAHERLNQIAREYGLSKSEVIRIALRSDFLPITETYQDMEKEYRKMYKEYRKMYKEI